MKNKPIIIISGDTKSIFFEIFFKSLKLNNFRSPLILVSSLRLLKLEMKKNKFKRKISLIFLDDLKNVKLNNKSINLINIDDFRFNKLNRNYKTSNSYLTNVLILHLKFKNGYI